MVAKPVGRVLGTEDATPLEFWVALAPEQYLQLDDVVVCERGVPGRDQPVRLSGVVTQVRARHEGALLKCLNPWSPRKEVIRCVQTLSFPQPLDPLPPGTQFVITGFITPSDEGLIIDVMLAPVIRGEPGVPVASRSVAVPFRGKRAARIKHIAALINPLLDAAQGLPPRGHAPPREEPRKPTLAEGED